MREPDAQDDVGDDEEGDEEGRVGEGCGRDDLGAGNVDGREAGRREEADQPEVHELSVAEGQGTASASYTATRARARSYETSSWSKSAARSSGESCEACRRLT